MKKSFIALALLCSMLLFESLRAETIRFGQTGSVTITPPKGWRVESRENGVGPGNHTVTLIADESRKPGCTIVIYAGERQPAYTEAGFLAHLENLYAESARQFVEKTPSFKKVDVNNGIGYYCVANYAAMAGKSPSKGTAKVCGNMSIYREKSPLIIASLYVDDPNDPALDLMVKAVCEMEVSFPSLPANVVRFSENDSVKIDIPAGWGAKRENGTPLPELERAYNVKLEPPSGEKALLTVTVGKSKTGKPLTRQQFDAATKSMADYIIPKSVEKKAVYKEMPVRGGRGVYCVFTDSSLVNKTAGPRQFKYAGMFLANYDSGCVVFATALTDDPTSESFQLMLRAVSSIEPSFATVVRTPPVQVTKTKDGVLIGNSISSIKLLIPSKNYKQEKVEKGAGGGRGQPSYFMGKDDKAGVVLSGWFEMASQFNYKDAKEMWRGEGLTKAGGVEYKTVNDWDVIVYNMIPSGTPIRQANIRANFLRDDVWIDLHLSVTDISGKRSLENMRKALLDYLATLQII